MADRKRRVALLDSGLLVNDPRQVRIHTSIVNSSWILVC
jgi:hypothetical protein